MSRKFVQCLVRTIGISPDVLLKEPAKDDPFVYYDTVAMEEFKEMKDKPKVYEGIVNSTSIDRHGDVVLPRGAVLDDYLQNPALQRHHIGLVPPIGNVLKLGVSDDQMKIFFTFDEADPASKEIQGKYDRKVMRAFSIGFMPLSEPVTVNKVMKSGDSEMEVDLPDGSTQKLDMSK